MSKVVILLPKADSVCGIYDYATNIYNEIRKEAADVSSMAVDDSAKSWWHCFTSLKNCNVVMQYPALAYRSSILPILYALVAKLRGIKLTSVVHENSEVSSRRRMLNRAITLLSHRIIVTNRVEYEYFPQRIQRKTAIIPIGANTPGEAPEVDKKQLNNKVVFFGLIRKDKGIEDFIELVDADQASVFHYVFVAGTTNVDKEYTDRILSQLKTRNVEIHLNKELMEVHDILCSCTYAFLTYPDGASERRGSLLAALKAGCVIFSNDGRQTPVSIQKVINSPNYKALSEMHDSSDENKRDFIAQSINLSHGYSWNKIASEIMKVATSENITIR
ncbi:hypothetical protein [Pluralibacter gergoviae]|uniref:Glycosyl transferase family 1 domain-containing protein n=1 Tax=Pluralibacter gergoviae TaxID=61647 RepID=A0AAW8HKB5_PLUGE|nr:hypothetical protein [Pluralibacter gergoviae]MDQ2309091.1 hypothetical protein [Pluralibacter gergoviae]